MSSVSSTTASSEAAPAAPEARPASRLAGAAASEQADRLAAFCSSQAPAVFESIVYAPQLWTPDPFDVPEIHAGARETFTRLLDRASGTPAPQSGKLLLLRGEAGSGKTHLMRAFRKLTHESRRGYFGYLQMSVKYDNYGRYLLGRLIDSLSQPYFPPEVAVSGLTRLSTWVFDAIPGITDEEKHEFREGGTGDVCRLVFEYADRALSDPRLQDCDVDLMRALLFLQRGVPTLKSKATSWLRCQDLTTYDRQALGGMVPRTNAEEAIRMVAQLGKLMALVEGAALVICVDQLDDMVRDTTPIKQFAEVIDTLVSLADEVPTAVIVVSCIEDYFEKGRQMVAKSKLDRLEHDPEPVRLSNSRNLDEIKSLLARRLDILYEQVELTPDPAAPTYPFQSDGLKPLVNLSTRNVLDNLRLHQQRCIAAGKWLEPKWGTGGPPPLPEITFEETWNDHQAQFKESIPEDEVGRAKLLASAIRHCNAELPSGYEFSVADTGSMFPAARHTPQNVVERFFIAVCEKSPQGGGLGNQVTQARKKADGTPLVVVRSTPFPKSPGAVIVQQLGQIIAKGGRRVEVEEADWRLMQAFTAFASAHAKDSKFAEWVRTSRPMSQLASLRGILELDKLPMPRALADAPSADGAKPGTPTSGPATLPPSAANKAAATPEKLSPPAPKPAPPAGPLRLGVTRGVTAQPVPLDVSELRQHMAFLGGSGSGKTTAALLIIEQLLQRGVPAILVDRKGDLCRYADPSAWASPDPATAQRLTALRQQVDVALYTPGAPAGRALRISVVPEGLAQMPTADREQLAEYAAAALAAMMGYNPKRAADKVHQVILAKAIKVLAEAPAAGAVTLDSVHDLVESRDPGLLNAAGGFDPKHYRKLAENLLTLKLSSTRLLGTESDERLDINALLGKSAPSGKTRLSIISTQALGDPAAVDFWVSQLLVALDRWRAKSPSENLQAVLMLDEADQYLPATRQPATKAPLESLLRRARSAGLGIFLATQSPGDFDYRCRDQIRNWLVGRVRETVALNKLKPMFADAKLDVAAKLPNQTAGEFILLREGQAAAVKADRSLMDTRQVEEGRILELAVKTR